MAKECKDMNKRRTWYIGTTFSFNRHLSYLILSEYKNLSMCRADVAQLVLHQPYKLEALTGLPSSNLCGESLGVGAQFLRKNANN